MKKLLLLSLIALSSYVLPARADVTPEKRQEIEKLLRLTGTEKLMTQVKDQMLAAFKTQIPGVSDAFWTKTSQRMDMHELLEELVPVYDKYYTLDDLKTVNAFYETPTGQKVLAALPQITQESMQIGQAWGQRIGAQIMAEAQQEKSKTPAP